IWGSVALVLCVLKPPLMVALVLAVFIGALNGGANLWQLWMMKPERMTASNWIGLAALLAMVIAINQGDPKPPMNALQCLALGCAHVAVRSAVFGLFKKAVVDALNRKYSQALTRFEKDEPETPEVRFDDVNQAHQAFLSVLPTDLREEFRACITQATLVKHASAFVAPFQSALGGAPVFPPGVSWPMWGEVPLDYLARINLAELPPSDVIRPPSGILEFFYGSDSQEQQPWGGDEEDKGSGAVIFLPDPEVARSALKPEAAGIPPAKVPLEFQTDIVMAATEAIQDRFYEHARALPARDRAKTYAIRDAMHEFEPYGCHRALSAPARVQGDMDDELVRAARLFDLPPGTEWVMLLQLDSDKAVNWQWCDDGAIYFWIPAADLALGRFDRVWVVLQSP
ncbi:MAG TPA: YwqG family protein, partial [Luteolibacter sp.]